MARWARSELQEAGAVWGPLPVPVLVGGMAHSAVGPAGVKPGISSWASEIITAPGHHYWIGWQGQKALTLTE